MSNRNLSQFQQRSLALFSANTLPIAMITMFTHDYFRHQHHSTSGLLAWLPALLPSLPLLGTIFLAPAMTYVDVFLIASMIPPRLHLRSVR